jgi:hypothetical protein
MVERFFSLLGGADKDLKVLLQFPLADIFGKALRAKRKFAALVFLFFFRV